jgi:2-polyprenyl-6-hydroxyphenyl methylase/3-demethylubiquinone-9 3-methyltransferase
MEVIEHVINFRSFIQQTCHLIGPDGLMFFATINRTYFSWLTTIFGAEYLLGWLPRGTHDWRRYVTPKEARSQLKLAGLTILLETGVAMNPFRRRLFLTKNMGANYMMLATKT